MSSKKIKNHKLTNIVSTYFKIIPCPIPNMIYMNEESWIKVIKLDDSVGLSTQEFDKLWLAKPKNRIQFKIGSLTVNCPRYTESYLRPPIENLKFFEVMPQKVEELMKFAQKTCKNLNQCTVNWYDKDGWVGKYSDDYIQMLPDSPIYSFSFGSTRLFHLNPRNGDGPDFYIRLEHNTIVVMGGKCQQYYLHSVPYCSNCPDNKRLINVTFRCLNW